MSYQVFNSTLSIVKTEVDQFLKDYTIDHPYRQALSFPYFRQKLIAKVLNNIPNNHILIDECHSFVDDISFCIGLLEEKLLITAKINEQISHIVEEYNQFNLTHNPDYHPKENALAKTAQLSWWIRIDTIKPDMTYYFGSFDNLWEAKENCSGYIEDLIEEKAEGITFDFQYINPPSLTIDNDIEDLRLENQQIWENLWDIEVKKKYYENLFLFSPDSCLILDKDGIIRVINDSAVNLFKTPREKLINKSLNWFISPHSLAKFLDFLQSFNNEINPDKTQSFFSLKFSLPDESFIIVSIKASNIKNLENDIIGWHLSLHDVTKLQQTQNELFHQSRYDSLTDLPNRRSLLEFLQKILNQEEKNHSSRFAVLFLDIDKFKDINDTFGHLIGDKVLITLAKRLITCVRNIDHVARLSGDEFMIVLSHINSSQEAKDCAYRIQKSLSTCFHVSEKKIMINVSIGIVIGDSKTSNLSNLLSNADMAMYQAKSNGELFSIYPY
ncbi:diguanylate cyclase domain-containing protein [Geminocystis sp. NIES-3709]|uniref:diguanylate cyclase domain-containing protein n=1 Tax=Geminocystis sp. NIES-3709 TaxID=1617448 RepID=UPI0005FC5049|nr:diguanylate cyclase [Geminocystis sp. NIES-3709]BAQ64629.1 diguanylate cyclase/phosphodiesterase with PAS/PAC sensor [Geminocystis sp. NIES-3709]